MSIIGVKDLNKKIGRWIDTTKGKREERGMFMVKIGHAFQRIPLNNNLHFINNLSKHVIAKKLHTRCSK